MSTHLKELYHDQIRDIFSAETQLLQSQPMILNLVASERLKEAIQSHLEETREQLERIRTIYVRHEIPASGEESQAMKGLLNETFVTADRAESGSVRDAAIIAMSSRIEHDEIAAYGAARAFAECQEFEDDVALPTATLEEEAHADLILTEIATGSLFRNGVNERAV
jgi:ferritin-like metal-binding protein YciE